MTPQNLLAEWSRLLIGTLVRAGISDVVLSPGSRSTPLVCALSEQHGVRVHVVIDERSAGFFALGQARATGKPSLCICTSGSAVANYYPAVVEAAESRVPLVIVSADRPFELGDARAPQTIDQTKLFGGYVRAFVEIGMPDDHPDALAALQRRATQAVVRASWPEPGAVHLNFRARKPLEPRPSDCHDGDALARRVNDLLARPPSRIAVPVPSFDRDAVVRLGARLATARRPVIACGPMPMHDPELGRAISELGARSGAILLAESASQARHGSPELAADCRCDGFDPLLDLPAGQKLLEPDLIVQFGRPLVSAAWERYVGARADVERWLVSDTPGADPVPAAREIVLGDARRVAVELERELATLGADETLADDRRAWRRRIAEADRVVWEAVAHVAESGAALTEARATRIVIGSVGAGEILALGNSLPIRDADWFCPGSSAALRVWSQRGTNGIDGVLSGAAGAASMSELRTTLLLGDIGLLHDVGGLWAARQLTNPLVIAVIDNGGGRIFEQLPLAEGADFSPETLERWTTPHSLDLSHAARLYGIESCVAQTADALESAVRAARTRSGATLIVAKVDPASARRERRRIAEIVASRLSPP